MPHPPQLSLHVQVFCGRYVNQHMVVHKDSAGHMMALSLADLSVWCYLCDSYIDNHVSTKIKTGLLSSTVSFTCVPTSMRKFMVCP